MANLQQLELFSPESDLIACGFETLRQLDFENALRLFREVLRQFDTHQEAQHGVVLCRDWASIFRKQRRLDRVRACELLWQSICEYDFGATAYASVLKQALLRKLAQDVERFDNHLFSDSGLCLGEIYCKLEEYSRAVQAFAPLLERYPYEPCLLVHYANALWQARDRFQAKLFFVKAWMIAPSLLKSFVVKDEDFKQLIVDEGPYMAPIYEWIRQGMPELECPQIRGENLEHVAALKIYDAVMRIHKMKIRGQFVRVEEAQKLLRRQAPEVSQAFEKLWDPNFKTSGDEVSDRREPPH